MLAGVRNSLSLYIISMQQISVRSTQAIYCVLKRQHKESQIFLPLSVICGLPCARSILESGKASHGKKSNRATRPMLGAGSRSIQTCPHRLVNALVTSRDE